MSEKNSLPLLKPWIASVYSWKCVCVCVHIVCVALMGVSDMHTIIYPGWIAMSFFIRIAKKYCKWNCANERKQRRWRQRWMQCGKKENDSNQIKRCMAFKTTTNKRSRRQFQFVPIHKWRNMNIQRYGIIVAHMHMALWRSLCTNIHTFATLCFSLYLTARFSRRFFIVRSPRSFSFWLRFWVNRSIRERNFPRD